MTNETLPAFSSGMDAALQNLAVTVQKAVLPSIRDVVKVAEKVAELEYRGERLPSWVSEEILRQMIPLVEENKFLKKALEQETARNTDMEKRLREYLLQRDVAQQEHLQGVTTDLSTKNAHLYGAFVDVSRRLEELQTSQQVTQAEGRERTSLLTSVNFGRGKGYGEPGPSGNGPVPMAAPPRTMVPALSSGKGQVPGVSNTVPGMAGNVRSLLPASGNPRGVGTLFADLNGDRQETTNITQVRQPLLPGQGKGLKGGRGHHQEYGTAGYGYRNLDHVLTQTMSDVMPIGPWDGNLDNWDDWFARWTTYSAIVFSHAGEDTLMFLLLKYLPAQYQEIVISNVQNEQWNYGMEVSNTESEVERMTPILKRMQRWHKSKPT